MNVQILGEIAEFERYDCTVWTPDCVFMKFYVRYNDNSKGYVYGCPFICGIVPSEFHLLILHYKIGVAKYLLGKEEWDYVRRKYGIERDKYLILSRGMNLY